MIAVVKNTAAAKVLLSEGVKKDLQSEVFFLLDVLHVLYTFFD